MARCSSRSTTLFLPTQRTIAWSSSSPARRASPLIDMAAGVDGIWDDDLYLDIVHFTEGGNERVAGLMFRALLPILADRHGVKCDVR